MPGKFGYLPAFLIFLASLEVIDLARRLANGPTLAYARTKELFNAAFDHNLAAHLGAECDRFVASTLTDDFAEGADAFVDKRPAKFRGR